MVGRGHANGFTLIELVVGAALLSLLLTMLYQTLVPTLKEVKRSEVDIDTQQAVALALNRLHAEASYSSPLSATIIQNPPCASYLSIDPAGEPGRPPLPTDQYQLLGLYTAPLRWQKFVLWYYDADARTLNRKEIPYRSADALSLAHIEPDHLPGLIDSTDYSSRAVARGIERVVFGMLRPPLLSIDVTSQLKGVHDQKETRIVFTTTMRN
ncbi:MAG: prepilin-type N-terminal cleavage/methylation domain-containing protein [Armatimonadetes bacterium]|nr:prepilin-type N-terminal cleavage/methylation domain-containing protein [Armatimonadota bacterium]